jgi:hypothetical protein
MISNKARIISDGTPEGTKLFDAEGFPISTKNIGKVTIEIQPDNFVKATVEFNCVKLGNESEK